MAEVFSSVAPSYADAPRAMNIKALEARQKDILAQAASANAITPENTQTPIQGFGHLANIIGDQVGAIMNQRRADEARTRLAQVIAGIDPVKGPTPAQAAQMGLYDDAARAEALKEMADSRKTAAQQAHDDAYQRAQFGHQDTTAANLAASQAAEKRLEEQHADTAASDAAAAQTERDRAKQAFETAKQAQADEEAMKREKIRLQAEQEKPHDQIAIINDAVAKGQITPQEGEAQKRAVMVGTASDVAARATQEGAHVDAQAAINNLLEAQDLVDVGVYNGRGAGLKSEYGPGLLGKLSDIAGQTDPETTKRDQRYNQIMSGVAGQIAKAMTGSQSDKELQFALKQASDPNATKEQKQQALLTIQAKLQEHVKISEQAVKDMRGTPKYLPPYEKGSSLVLSGPGPHPPISGAQTPATPAPAAPAPAAPAPAAPAPAAPAPAAPASDPLAKARAAIAGGADRAAVIKRLEDAGIKADGL